MTSVWNLREREIMAGNYRDELYHYGVLGMKWGVRRYRDYDGRKIGVSKASLKETGSGHIKDQHRANIRAIETANVGKSKKEALLRRENMSYKAALYQQDKIDHGKEVAKKALIVAGVVGVASLTAYGVYKYKEANTPSLDADKSVKDWLVDSVKGSDLGTPKTFSGPVKADAYQKATNFSQDYWENTLHAGHRAAVQAYTGEGPNSYRAMNKALRFGAEASPTTQMYSDLLTEVLDGSRIKEDCMVHRGIGSSLSKMVGVDAKALKKDPGSLIGMEFTDKGFVSTGASMKDAWGGVKMHVVVPAGSKGMYVDPVSSIKGEHEVLLQRNSSFEIRDVKTNSLGVITDILVVLTDQER